MRQHMRLRFLRRTLVSGIVLCAGIASGQLSPPQGELQETRKLMDSLLGELLALKPHMVSEEKFKATENEANIALHLKEFTRLARLTQHDPELKTENYKFSQHVFEEHIADTERSFRLGSKSYARWQLMSTVSLCMNCHIQLPLANAKFGQFTSAGLFTSPFEKAEFYFSTRAFDQALRTYENLVQEFPANKVPQDQVETALDRQLAYYGRLTRDPDTAIKKLKAQMASPGLPKLLKKEISSAIDQFQIWKKEPSFDARRASEEQILEFARKHLKAVVESPRNLDQTGSRNVALYRTSGVLLEYLRGHATSKAVPEVLYWLAVCDYANQQGHIFALSELYLRECMMKYPANPIAKKCYSEYESQKIFGYTGSSGTHLPPDVQKELEQLKRLVDSGGKVPFHGH